MKRRLSQRLKRKRFVCALAVGLFLIICIIKQSNLRQIFSAGKRSAAFYIWDDNTTYSWMKSFKSGNYNYTELLRPKGVYKGIPYLVVVASGIMNRLRRSAIRDTWAKGLRDSDGAEAAVVFLLGRSEIQYFQKLVNTEHTQYGDIVQFDFKDTFRNASLKTVLMLRWASKFNPTYLVKADDDTIVNVRKLRLELQSLQANFSKPVIAGYELIHVAPRRMKNDKWAVSEKEYPDKLYPNFVSGCLYVISGKALAPLYETALNTRPLSLEDVFVTGLVATRAGIPRVSLKDIEILGLDEACEMHEKLAVHHISASRMRLLSRVLSSFVRHCTSLSCSCIPLASPQLKATSK
ncbi:beta-1,3-galactosyltransferase 5-like isoform X1 [Varroa jacobsoni]|uniref:Hexosyltransferase n=1 Tax=Varroa destructor TaxID=109461 RepID=A0A7M7J0C7_VARDE|nr:beta-1,3-galactosyltransferase 5-like isoform X2 [Varroa destructor]XP_022698316.1 beta-1,3-galactosyltransferase 5-like isoform X1 [Varroa jacobsoni]XP_022698317.1 beta-1,3-galactosyltransferase 5-like isoform X1 [Varroa jacobsoni]